MIMNRNILAIVCAVNLLAFAPRAEMLTGRVVDPASNPLATVRVTLSQARVSDTTVADGLFSLIIPGSGLVMDGGATLPGFSIAGNRLELRVENPQRVSAALFAVTGKEIAIVLDRTLAAGKFTIPFDAAGLRPGLYVLAVDVNRTHAFAKVLASSGSAFIAAPETVSPDRASAMSKSSAAAAPSTTGSIAAVLDTLSFAKAGYFTKKMGLESLAARDFGNVVLAQDKITVKNANYDQYDEIVMDVAAKNGLDSAMDLVIKAMMVVESSFNAKAISMYDTRLPCGTHSYGLIQVTPGCGQGYATLPAGTKVTASISGGLNGSPAKLAYGDPADQASGNTIVEESGIIVDLVGNPANPLWPTSAFNPAYSIDRGAKAIHDVLAEMKGRFKSCTDANYVAMALADYNQGSEVVTDCLTYGANGRSYADKVLSQYRAFCKLAGITPLY